MTPFRQLRIARSLARDERGTAAIEFAFVAGPFMFMIFAVIELALVFLLSTSLDSASDQAARRIRTGQFQSANQTASDFKSQICANMTWMATNCSTALSVDVRVYDTYSTIPAHTPVKVVAGKKTFDDTTIQFAPSIPASKVVVVRSYYKWPLISPLMNEALSRLDGGVALVRATQTFKTEPYQ